FHQSVRCWLACPDHGPRIEGATRQGSFGSQAVVDQRRNRVHTLDVRGYDLRPARPLWVLIPHSLATAAVSALPELGPPMDHPGFFDRASPIAISELAAATSSSLPEGLSEEIASRKLSDVRALADAGPNDVTFLDNRKYLPQLSSTRAGACLVLPA